MGNSDDTADMRSPLGRAVRDTQRTVVGAADRVESLRVELGGRIDVLDSKVDDIALSNARVEGQVGVLVDELQAARTIRVTAAQASIEIEKTGEIAKVEDGMAERKHRRDLAIKYATIAGSLAATGATLITLLASRC